MTSRHYRSLLTVDTITANKDDIANAVYEWHQSAAILDTVAVRVRDYAASIGGDIEGEAGAAMVVKIHAISDKLTLDSEAMIKGSEALVIAGHAIKAALDVRDILVGAEITTSPPTKPEGPIPGASATPEQTQALATYNSDLAQYESNEAVAEQMARAALHQLDQQYVEAATMMQEIHGEPDPAAPASPSSPSSPSGPSGPYNSNLPAPTSPNSSTYTPTGWATATGGDNGNSNGGDNGGTGKEPIVKDPIVKDPIVEDPIVKDPVISDPDPINKHLDTGNGGGAGGTSPQHQSTVPSSTNVLGQTDGGSTYHGVQTGSATSGSAGSAAGFSSGGGASAGLGSGAAAGIAGAGLGAGIKGGVTGSSSALKAGSVRGIGAGGRPAASGSLTRGASASPTARGAAGASGARSASGTRAAGAPGAGSTSRSAGAGSRAGAAGATGSKGSSTKGSRGAKGAGKGASKGRGLFRRGTNGSTAGGRSGKKKDDERSTESESLVYEQDWLGEDTAAPSVLD